jgi:hypothetical protein
MRPQVSETSLQIDCRIAVARDTRKTFGRSLWLGPPLIAAVPETGCLSQTVAFPIRGEDHDAIFHLGETTA